MTPLGKVGFVTSLPNLAVYLIQALLGSLMAKLTGGKYPNNVARARTSRLVQCFC
jgi:hypothetical protein